MYHLIPCVVYRTCVLTVMKCKKEGERHRHNTENYPMHMSIVTNKLQG